MKNAKILVIEDENSATMSIKPKLERLGYTVLAVESHGIKTIKDSRELKPDLILMDISQSGDHIKTSKKIREYFDNPILYLTNPSKNQLLEKVQLDPPVYIIKKQFSSCELKSTIETALYNYFKLKDSTKNLNAFLNAVNEPAFLIDLKGNILFTNEYTEKILGKVVGSNIYELLPSHISAYRKKYVETAIKTKKITRFEDERYGKNYEYRIYPILDEKNEVSKLSVIGLDVTERKIAESALRESEEKYRSIFENSTDAIFLTRPDGSILDANPAAEEMYGYTKDEMCKLGRSCIVDTNDPQLYVSLNERTITGRFKREFNSIKKDGRKFLTDVTGNLFKDSSGTNKGIIIARDSTERKKIEYELKENQRALKTLISNLPGVAYRCKNDSSWTIEFVSEGCLELTGYQVEDLVMNKNVSYADLIHIDDRKMVWDTIQKALKENEPFKITYRIITADLKEKYVWEQGRGIFSPEGELIALEGFITDVTKRKEVESALKKSELYYRTIFENTGTAILIAGEDTIISLANTECEKLSGYLKEEIEGKKSWTDFAVEEDLEQLINYHQLRGINPDAVPKNFEIKLINKQGDIRDVYVTIALIPYTNNRLISLLDITDKKRSRKALQESEVKFREIFNNANDMITVSEVKENGIPGRFMEVNDVASEMLGYTKEEFLNMTPFDIVHPDMDASLPKIELEMSKNGYARHESILIAKNRSIIPVEVATHSFKLQGKDVILAISRDITERKKAEEGVKASLKEKELLLREIHHRVKNNLQIISSLLSLQTSYTKDNETRNVLEESQNRVKSMAIAHEKLYNSENLVKIDFKDYVNDLTDSLFLTYKINENRIKLNKKIDNIFFDVNTLIPCGLILNELVTNSLKHAFPAIESHDLTNEKFSDPMTVCSEGFSELPNKTNEIRIELHQSKNKFMLIVSDNGIGLPKNVDFKDTESLGLKLVTSLIKQLDGTIEIDKTEGTTFRIIFKELKYKERI